MSDLSPEARALLASLASSHDPPPEAAARVRAAVDARVARPTVPRRWPWLAGGGLALVLAAAALTRYAPTRRSDDVPRPVPVRSSAIVVTTDVPAAQSILRDVPEPPPPPRPVPRRRVDADMDDLAGELALLAQAQRALARGAGDEALDALDRHARRYPRGRLVEEREAARVLALCAAGRGDEARAAATRFVARHPGSPQAARVSRACAR